MCESERKWIWTTKSTEKSEACNNLNNIGGISENNQECLMVWEERAETLTLFSRLYTQNKDNISYSQPA